MWYASIVTHTAKIDKFMASTGLPEIYRVGGSVRDERLGRKVKDCDYVVREVELDAMGTALRRTGAKITKLKLRDGRQVGWRANKSGLGLVEICMPRTEIARDPKPGENKRHAFEIVTNPNISLHEDAVRRDLTINSLYRRITDGEVLDPLGLGFDDLENKVLRTTHESSFRDDPLRIMRALRFRATLGFPLAESTLAEMRKYANEVTGLTAKGVSGTALDELSKLLMGRHVAAALRDMRDTGVMVVLLPELEDIIGYEQGPYHDLTTDEHTFVALDVAAGLGCSLRVRMALLFHDSGKPQSAWIGKDGHPHFYDNGTAEHHIMPMYGTTWRETSDHAEISARFGRKALKRLNAESKLINAVYTLDKHHMVPLTMKVKPTKVRKWRCEFGDDLLADLLKHRLCDVMGKEVIDYEAVKAVARMEKIREEAEHAGVPASPKDLKDAGLIDGNDLKEMGIRGSEIGRILKTLLHEVVSQPDRADREWLLQRARKLGNA